MNIKELKNLISFIGKVEICVFTPAGERIKFYPNGREFYLDESIDDLKLSTEVRPVDFMEGGLINIWTE